MGGISHESYLHTSEGPQRGPVSGDILWRVEIFCGEWIYSAVSGGHNLINMKEANREISGLGRT